MKFTFWFTGLQEWSIIYKHFIPKHQYAYSLYCSLCIPKVLTRRICLTIKSILSWWSFPLFLWPCCVIQGRYCWEKLDANHSKGSEGWGCLIWSPKQMDDSHDGFQISSERLKFFCSAKSFFNMAACYWIESSLSKKILDGHALIRNYHPFKNYRPSDAITYFPSFSSCTHKKYGKNIFLQYCQGIRLFFRVVVCSSKVSWVNLELIKSLLKLISLHVFLLDPFCFSVFRVVVDALSVVWSLCCVCQAIRKDRVNDCNIAP